MKWGGGRGGEGGVVEGGRGWRVWRGEEVEGGGVEVCDSEKIEVSRRIQERE